MTARIGILGLVGYVLAWDIATARSNEQLSDGLRRITARHPYGMRIVALMLAAHCCGDLPRYLDPISGIGWALARVR